jgi:hypothetical protein
VAGAVVVEAGSSDFYKSEYFTEAGFKEVMAPDTGTAGYDETISDTFVKN